jgi:O-antigen ligase
MASLPCSPCTVVARGDTVLQAEPLAQGLGAAPAEVERPAPRFGLGYLAFLAVNASLFVRPSEVIPGFADERIYLLLILICLVLYFPAVFSQLRPQSLCLRPISVCVLGVLAAVALSRLAKLDLTGGLEMGFEFAKVVVYYLLLVGLVNSTQRLRRFLFWLTIFFGAATILALADYRGVIDLPTITPVLDYVYDPQSHRALPIQRLRGTGIFQDPNDVCLVLVSGIALSWYWAEGRRFGLRKLFWLAMIGLFGYTLSLTYSRGGFLALLVGVLVWFRSRYGWNRTLLLAAVAVPLLFVLFAGRQTSLSTRESTGQSRIQLWSDALVLFKQNPLFGVGREQYREALNDEGPHWHVAHNSFLHCYVELGFLGGTCFVGAFYLALRRLHRLESVSPEALDPELLRLRPCLLTTLAAYATGLFSLSNSYSVPTYMMLGLATAYFRLIPDSAGLPADRCDARLLGRLLAVSVAFLATIYFFVRLFMLRA